MRSISDSPSKPANPVNLFSQKNVLLQLEHLMTYPMVRERVQKGTLGLHAWWFDLMQADVFHFDESLRAFVRIEDKE